MKTRRNRKPRTTIRGGEPECVHWFVFGRPKFLVATLYIQERGVCKKCGAIQEFLRPAYRNWENDGDFLGITDAPIKVKVEDEGYD